MPRFVPVEELFKGRHFDHVALCFPWYLALQTDATVNGRILDKQSITLGINQFGTVTVNQGGIAPEPSTLVLTGGVLVLLGWTTRRRRS